MKLLTNQCRLAFLDSGLTYSDIDEPMITDLHKITEEHLCANFDKEMRMKINPLRKKDVSFDRKTGKLKEAYIRVQGSYFGDREGISFNPEKQFIGFAGWSDSINVQPFLSAFMEWVNKYKKNAQTNQ